MTKPKGVFKKRVFRGNKHLKIINPVARSEPVSPVNLQQENPKSEVSFSGSSQSPSVSASKKKLSSISINYHQEVGSSSNIIIDLNILNVILNETVSCNICGGLVKISEDQSSSVGLVNKLKLLCGNCGLRKDFFYF